MKDKFTSSIRAILLGIAAFLLSAPGVAAQADYLDSLTAWRAKHEAELRSDDGWLTVTGLFWLKEGRNAVGVGPQNDVELPAGSAPASAGVIDFQQGVAQLTIADGVTATVEGRPVRTIHLKPDDKEKPSVVQLGDVTFNLIKRGESYGVRVKDRNSPRRRAFRGLRWFPANPAYRVQAQLTTFANPREILIPNVLGSSYRMKSIGLLKFSLAGKDYTLQPVMDGKQFFIIFSDLTRGKATYPGGRFLYAELPAEGPVTLDFNQAYNPPCAFTPFATCPLPPPQNRLPVTILAGEKSYRVRAK